MALSLVQMAITDYRLLHEAVFEPAPNVSVLIGANNAGKSSLIDPLVFLRTARKEGPSQAFLLRHGFERIVYQHETQRQPSIRLTLREPDGISSVILQVRLLGEGLVRVETVRPPDPSTASTDVSGGSQLVTASGFSDVEAFLDSLVHVDPFRSVQVQSQVGAVAEVQESGSNLAQVLHYHYTSNRERFDEFEDAVRKVLPEVDIIETPIIGSSLTTVTVRFRDESNRYDL